MLLPRYSIRAVLYLAVIVALLALVAGQAVVGTTWAIGITIAVASLAVVWLVYVLFYGMVVGFARVALPGESRSSRPAHYPELRRTRSEGPDVELAQNSASEGGPS